MACQNKGKIDADSTSKRLYYEFKKSFISANLFNIRLLSAVYMFSYIIQVIVVTVLKEGPILNLVLICVGTLIAGGIFIACLKYVGTRPRLRKIMDTVILAAFAASCGFSLYSALKETSLTQAEQFSEGVKNFIRHFFAIIVLISIIEKLWMKFLLILTVATLTMTQLTLTRFWMVADNLDMFYAVTQACVCYMFFQFIIQRNEFRVIKDFADAFDRNVTWRKVIDFIPFGVVIFDLKENILFHNPNSRTFFQSLSPNLQFENLQEFQNFKIRKETRIDKYSTLNVSKSPELSNSDALELFFSEIMDLSLKALVKKLLFQADGYMKNGIGWDSEKKEPSFFYGDAKIDGKSVEIAFGYTIFNENISLLLLIQDTSIRDEIARIEDRNQYKSFLLSSVSHELRTPMNGSSLLLQEMLESTELSDDIKQKYLKPVLLNMRRLSYMIQGISDYSELSFGKSLILQNVRFNIREFLIEILEVVKFEVQAKGLGLKIEVESEVPGEIYTDKERLGELLMNLLSNAVKFTQRGEIALKIGYSTITNILDSNNEGSLQQTKIEFVVEDTGIGMTEEELERLKLLLARELFEGKISSASTGACLGLKISNVIAKSMGSELKFSSVTALGTTVSFELPSQEVLSDDVNRQNSTLWASDYFQEAVQGQQLSIDEKAQMIELRSDHFDIESIKPSFPIDIRRSADDPRLEGSFDSAKAGFNKDNNSSYRIPILNSIDLKQDRLLVEEKKGKSSSFRKPNSTSSLLKKTLKAPSKPNKEAINTKFHSFESDHKSNLMSLNSYLGCPTILIVDDDPFNVDSIQRVLSKKGILNAYAFNGKEAVEKLEKLYQQHTSSCDLTTCEGTKLVLMDYNMPIMNGCEATEVIKRKSKEGKMFNCLVVGCTAYSGQTEKSKCFKAGMDELLIKPIRIEPILALLQ